MYVSQKLFVVGYGAEDLCPNNSLDGIVATILELASKITCLEVQCGWGEPLFSCPSI